MRFALPVKSRPLEADVFETTLDEVIDRSDGAKWQEEQAGTDQAAASACGWVIWWLHLSALHAAAYTLNHKTSCQAHGYMKWINQS